MAKIIPFRRKRYGRRKHGFPSKYSGFIALIALILIGSISWNTPHKTSAHTVSANGEIRIITPKTIHMNGARSLHFAKCGLSKRYNCVVDGDTIYLNGQKTRLAGIDTPETHPARCSYEAKLGARATRRLTELLNNGPFTVKSISDRDEDRYGRKLRTLHRSGQSLGSILVAEGLARKWQGRRLPWCT